MSNKEKEKVGSEVLSLSHKIVHMRRRHSDVPFLATKEKGNENILPDGGPTPSFTTLNESQKNVETFCVPFPFMQALSNQNRAKPFLCVGNRVWREVCK